MSDAPWDHRCGDCGHRWLGPEEQWGPCPSCGSPEGDWLSCPDCLSCGVGGCCDYYCNRCKHHHDGETQTGEPPRDFGDCSGERRIRYSSGPPREVAAPASGEATNGGDPASTASATPGSLFPAENDPKNGEAA